MAYIRYFAATDDSLIGGVALEYLRSMLRLAPVRVASVSAGLTGRWEHYAQLLGTPLVGTFVNVVCCAPARWTWTQRVVMPNPDGTVTPAAQEFSLYTSGVRNVLLADRVTPLARLPANLAYEAIVVPDDETAGLWNLATGRRPDVIPIPVTDHAAMRRVVLP